MLVVAVGNISAQIAGSTTTGISVEELKTIARGWSATKQILGKPVYNDKNEKVGDVDDLIIAPDSSISYAIIGVGGFLGWANARWRSPSTISSIARGGSCYRKRRRTPCRLCRHSNTRNKGGLGRLLTSHAIGSKEMAHFSFDEQSFSRFFDLPSLGDFAPKCFAAGRAISTQNEHKSGKEGIEWKRSGRI